MPHRFTSVALLFALTACGAKTIGVEEDFDAGDARTPQLEICNGYDDDIDSEVDEGFRDSQGRYVSMDNCGACGATCALTDIPNALDVTCSLIADTPVCNATQCAEGFARSSTGRCVSTANHACLPCLVDADCGDIEGVACVSIAGESRCAFSCELGCDDGYECADGVCLPQGGSCSCDAGDNFDLACPLTDPMGARCPGTATCRDGIESECLAPDEVCDEVDNDCNGTIDDGFRDRFGAYSLDIHNCGQCGVDCTDNPVPEGDLVCGGDPFAPTCVLLCPDAVDGVMPGDRVDGDRNIATGCECTVGALDDVPGPVNTSGESLDVNCDGADGIVTQSFYVSPNGNDSNVGSPTRPLRTISAALTRAKASLMSATPRPHIYVASGNYTETISIPAGISLHGGYRADFLSLDPTGFRVEVRAPADTTAPGGAALTATDSGTLDTLVEWIVVRGVDAQSISGAAFGAYLQGDSSRLVMRDMEVHAGVGGAGQSGDDGAAGTTPTSAAVAGDLPRGASEDAMSSCRGGAANMVAGGRGAQNTCRGVNVSGGVGGSSHCPSFAEQQPSGQNGLGVGGGIGGAGGIDSQGPSTRPPCPSAVCCGLADFSVPDTWSEPLPGGRGRDGSRGMAGRGCTSSLGSFTSSGAWQPDVASSGTSGAAGAGGGGGGAGGGSEFNPVPPRCVFADGLGGGGGGGGAGGCGGDGGAAGSSGGPSVAIAIFDSASNARVPTLSNVVLVSADGGRGGDGGAGGDGAYGSNGALGGELPRIERTTPTLSGPVPGAPGGAGGNGGAGGGGGGGCGGASVGIWVSGGAAPSSFATNVRMTNTINLGNGGAQGRGGGGEAAAADGVAGESIDVVTR